jgi:hypothetical protein
MGTALTVIIMYSLSVLIIRVATVSLRLTGLNSDVARFQALSAFSGAGFTTSESEQIVNCPVRRRIIIYLVILGNLGLTAILATLVVGFVNADGELSTILTQLVWIIASLLLIWFLILNPVADRLMCRAIHKVLIRNTELGRLTYTRLTQLDNDWEIGEHKVAHDALTDNEVPLAKVIGCLSQGELLFLRLPSGESIYKPGDEVLVVEGSTLIISAPKNEHYTLFQHLTT